MQETIKKIRTELAPLYSPGETENLIKIIFENILHYTPVDIIMHKDSVLSDFIIAKTDKVVARLLNHEPIQYIFQEAYFHGNILYVTPDVLIPRPETEELVDIIVKENSESDLNVLDIGTGSGAIAVALARALRFPKVSAFDISQKAIEVAQENAKRLKVKIEFQKIDILTAKAPTDAVFDIIVSNPPYIAEKEKALMEANVLDHEPSLALFVPNDDPLRFYRAIGIYARKTLKPNGKLYFEINSAYGKETCALLQQLGFFDLSLIKDMYGKDRFVTAKNDSE